MRRFPPNALSMRSPFAHVTHEGVTHNFINTSALKNDWHHVHAIGQPMNLTVRMLPDGRVHARTAGFSAMGCGDECPFKDPNQIESRSPTSNIEEIDFAWSAQKHWSTKTQTGLKEAVSGVAHHVANEPRGTYQFCSSGYSVDGLLASVGFNFYGDNYTPNIPPAC